MLLFFLTLFECLPADEFAILNNVGAIIDNCLAWQVCFWVHQVHFAAELIPKMHCHTLHTKHQKRYEAEEEEGKKDDDASHELVVVPAHIVGVYYN